MTEHCNARCKAAKSLSARLKAAQTYARPTGDALPHHNKVMSKVLVERATNRCTYDGCKMSDSIGHETKKAISAGEIQARDMKEVSILVVKELERKAADLADRGTLMQDKILKAQLQQLAKDRHR